MDLREFNIKQKKIKFSIKLVKVKEIWLKLKKKITKARS